MYQFLRGLNNNVINFMIMDSFSNNLEEKLKYIRVDNRLANHNRRYYPEQNIQHTQQTITTFQPVTSNIRHISKEINAILLKSRPPLTLKEKKGVMNSSKHILKKNSFKFESKHSNNTVSHQRPLTQSLTTTWMTQIQNQVDQQKTDAKSDLDSNHYSDTTPLLHPDLDPDKKNNDKNLPIDIKLNISLLNLASTNFEKSISSELPSNKYATNNIAKNINIYTDINQGL
ncbi:hypothetical protein BB561_006453, partial [Smittium simulii]